MKNHWLLSVTLVLACLSCGQSNLFSSFEEEPSGIEEAALALEQGDPKRSVALLKLEIGTAATAVFEGGDPNNATWAQNLKASLAGVPFAKEKVTLLATANAESVGVGVLNIAAELSKIEEEEKAKGLALLLSDNTKAIATFFPLIGDGGEVAIDAIDRSVECLNAFAEEIKQDATSDKLGALLTKGILSVVRFVGKIKSGDANGDKTITADEAVAITDGRILQIYSNMLDTQQTINDLESKAKDLFEKTKTKVDGYIADIQGQTLEFDTTTWSEEQIIAAKVRQYLVATIKP